MSPTTLTKLALHTAAATMLLLSTGCSTVTTKNPVGEPPTAEDVEQLSILDGVWTTNDSGSMHVKHIGNAQLRIATVEWEEDHFTTTHMTGLIRKLGERHFVNVRDADKPDDPYMFFYLIPASDNVIIGYPPNVDAFKAAVEAGELAGEVKSDDKSTTVTLTGETTDLNAYLTDERIKILFEMESPMVFHKVADLE